MVGGCDIVGCDDWRGASGRKLVRKGVMVHCRKLGRGVIVGRV